MPSLITALFGALALFLVLPILIAYAPIAALHELRLRKHLQPFGFYGSQPIYDQGELYWVRIDPPGLLHDPQNGFPEEIDLARAQIATGITGLVKWAVDHPNARAELRLQNSGPSKLQVIKAVRDVTGLGLAEAKSVVDGRVQLAPMTWLSAKLLQLQVQKNGGTALLIED